MHVADILDNAAALIEEHGWCRFKLKDNYGRMCIAGAVLRARSGMAGVWTAEDAKSLSLVFKTLSLTTGKWPEFAKTQSEAVVSWNNALDDVTGKAKVIAALREAARACRETEENKELPCAPITC